MPLSPSQLENATAPLRLCARLSGWEWGGPEGKAATFSDRLKLGVGVAIGLGIEGRRVGIRRQETGYAPALLQCWENLAAKFERSMRARRQPGLESIPIPIPTPTPIQTRIGRIGRIGGDCLEAEASGG